MNEERLFKAFSDRKCGDLRLYEAVKNIVESEVKDAEGRLSAKHYDFLVKLNNSENNAGWEDRHSDRISAINAAIFDICMNYEDCLP